MDDLLPRLLSFPPHPPPPNPPSNEQYNAAIIPHVMMVQKIPDKQLLAPTSSGENTLDVIDPSLHTVPYIYILLAQISEAQQKNTKTDPTWLMSKITNFMTTFNPIQMRYLGTAFEKLVNQVVMLVRRLGQPYAAVNPIRDALLRLDPAGSMLTSTHLLLVKISLDTRYFAGAVPVISKPILYFPGPRDQPKDKLPCDLSLSTPAYITPESGLTLKLRHIDVLEYFLLSGMIFIGLKDWEKALGCLENAVTYPTKDGACSKIMVTAYKKWVLVSVLLEGKPINLPKSTSNAPAKLYHTIAKPYETVATLFETATAGRLKSEVEAGQRIWEDDMNAGLMSCVLAAYQKFQIRKLALIYSKISIPEIVNLTMSAETGNRTSSQAVEQLVQTMIQEGSLMATLSQTPGRPSVLTFAASGLILSEAQIKSQLLATTQRIQALSHDIKVTDRLLTHDKDYIKHLVAVKNRAKDGVPAGHEVDWNESGIMEEDLMETDKWFQPE